MTRARATNPYREFEIHSGRRLSRPGYSTSALQAAIDHLRAVGSRRDEIKVL